LDRYDFNGIGKFRRALFHVFGPACQHITRLGRTVSALCAHRRPIGDYRTALFLDEAGDIQIWNTTVLAGLIAAIIAILTRSVIFTIITGLGVLWIIG
jgi:hypothetical protein